jgi:hypothetical protein
MPTNGQVLMTIDVQQLLMTIDVPLLMTINGRTAPRLGYNRLCRATQ